MVKQRTQVGRMSGVVYEQETTLPGLPFKVRVYSLGKCRIFVGQEPCDFDQEPPGVRWHLSISHPWRHPTWGEIGSARDHCIPSDVWLCMPHPPREFWLNIHEHCFHLWEIKDIQLIAQWRHDGQAAASMGGGS